jgi:uroporphyrinogen decarboxylase
VSILTGKELISKVMRHEEVPRVPWVPFTGVHAGFLKNYAADEVLQDADKLYESLLEVVRLYKPDGMPICFDLQLEAEILGCELQWAKDAPPSVISHPLADTDEIPNTTISKNDGRLPLVFDVTKRIKKQVGDEIAIYGLFCGPFTLASHLRGSKIFMNMLKNPDYMNKLMAYCTEIALTMVDFYIEAGVDVVAPVDPLISQISPKHFNAYCSENYKKIFKRIREKGAFSSFFVCGNAIKNIEVMCQTGPDGISVDENLPMKEAKEITDRYNVAIGGNIPLTTVMLFGNQQDNMKFVIDMLDNLSHKNLIISPGCDMPYNVPAQNGIACAQAVHDPEKTRKFVENYKKVDDIEDIEVELPDYENRTKPIVEIFTLDPEACAACTYMLAVWEEARKELGSFAEWGDYRYNIKEDIARMRKLGVKNLPSIYINGKLRYDSLIPSKEELINEIRKA